MQNFEHIHLNIFCLNWSTYESAMKEHHKKYIMEENAVRSVSPSLFTCEDVPRDTS